MVVEIVGTGFIGSTNDTDDRIIWVEAASVEEVERAIEGVPVVQVRKIYEPRGCDPVPDDIDYRLPEGAEELRRRLQTYNEES